MARPTDTPTDHPQQQPHPAGELLTVPQVAQLLGISDRTVRRLVQRGELSAYRVGDVLRFDPTDLRRYLTAHRVDATDQQAKPGDDLIRLDAVADDQLIHLAEPIALAARDVEVDRERGVVRGVALITEGPARGHGFDVDAVLVQQIAQQINAEPDGVRSRLTHPADLDGVESLVGRVRNAQLRRTPEGLTQARGDLHLGAFAAATPRGNLREYILSIAETDPTLIGLSVVFRDDGVIPDPDQPGRVFARSRGVVAADLVGIPAANPTGLLSAQHTPHRGTTTMPNSNTSSSSSNTTAANQTGNQNSNPSASANPTGQAAGGNASTGNTNLNAGGQNTATAGGQQTHASAAGGADPVQLERLRTRKIYNTARSLHLGDEWAMQHVLAGTDPEQARQLAVAELGHRHPPIQGLGGQVSVGDDGRQSLAAGISDALALQHGASIEKPHPRSRELRGLSLIEMARHHLQTIGVNTAGMARSEVARLCFNRSELARHGIGDIALAHTTSDFPAILGDAANRRMRLAYDQAEPTWRTWARRVEAPDFKEIKALTTSQVPTPPRVLEGAEYTFAYVDEVQEVYRVAKYGHILALTWEAIVNDDLQAFMRLARDLALGAARLEDDLVYALITENQTMTEDGKGLFHADHRNLNEGHGTAALDVGTLTDMRAALALQRGPDTTVSVGEQVLGSALNLRAAHLLVPVELQTQAEQLVASTVDPRKSNDTQQPRFIRELNVVGEPRLSANSTTAHYLVASNAQIDTVEVAFLDGMNGPTVEMEDSWRTDGREYKLRTVVGARAIDFRGLQRNDGA